jgi:pimeloyl-[acyl-carrier protein] methyl ester esterase
MQLVFIHGWGFEARFWDALAALLPGYKYRRIDLGFFGEAADDIHDGAPSILVGHSLGFLYGINRYKNWAGWIAINSFSRFVATDSKAGCVNTAALRTMRKKLPNDPQDTLAEFYALIGATASPAKAAPRVERLCEGLDELRDSDIGGALAAAAKPGLALAARNDPLVPVAASEALQVPHARLYWHPDGGHLLPQSAAPWCAEKMTGFMKEHFA